MCRRLVPLAMLFAAVLIGCDAKPSGTGSGTAPGGGPSSGGDTELRGDPAATYTIKVRDEEVGDRAVVSRVVSTSTTGTTAKQGTTLKKEQKESERHEFTETIITKPAGAIKPTKLTRAYRLAERTGADGKVKTLSYQGKTLTIEKGAGGMYTVKSDDGKPLPKDEAGPLTSEFNKGDKLINTQSLMPKAPVKIGEEWTPDAEAVRKMLAALPFPADPDRSKITGRLARAYTRDGKQWGEIVLRLDIAVGGPTVSPGGAGTITGEMTFDTPIDGSSHEGTMKMKAQGSIKYKQGPVENELVLDITREETIKQVK